jgi:hypothetical protein
MAINSHQNELAIAVSGGELPVSFHLFRFWGALKRTTLFLFGGLIALMVGLGSLGGFMMALPHSAFEAVLWGVFSLCGFIVACATVYEAFRLFLQTPSVLFVYRSGLRWQKRGKETAVAWAEIARVERHVSVFVHMGRTHRVDTTTLFFTSRKKLRFWEGILSDYATFADSVKYFHEGAQLAMSAPASSTAKSRRTKEIRCWHCGEVFHVPVTELSAEVRCRRCKAGLGVMLA